MSIFFVLEKVQDPRFPYRLTLRSGERVLLALRVQEKWPGQKGNIFCVREERGVWACPCEEVERVPVSVMKRLGKRLSLVLERPTKKRCDFLFLTKQYKTKEGQYEQIFWRTQKALTAHRPKAKLSTSSPCFINVVIDSSERYPWKFPGCHVARGKLPVGDYAVVDERGEILAVVERKTFENMLAEFGRMPLFHQQLAELCSYPNCALVIESNYGDFLNPSKVPYYKPSFMVMALAEINALHPSLPVVFAGNRKLGQEWTLRFFHAVQTHKLDTPHPKIREVMGEYQKSSVGETTKPGSSFDSEG
ncbi:MAG: ERCC4 domain-containing protein [bacterium]